MDRAERSYRIATPVAGSPASERKRGIKSGPRRRGSTAGVGFESGQLLPIFTTETFRSDSQPRAVLCAAKDDEGVYRLHS